VSSPEEPAFRRRRRRSRRSSTDGSAETNRASDQSAAGESGTARRAGRRERNQTAGQDQTAGREQTAERDEKARRSRITKPVGRRSGTTGGAVKPAGRQPGEPSARTIRETERGWRDLAGSGASQLGVSGALRARDVARPGPDELAEAERNVQLVRRQWQPPAD